jgi:hypothetical protein
MAFDALSGQFVITTQWNAQKNITGFNNPQANQNSDVKTTSWTKVGSGVGQVQTVSAGLLSIPASSSASLDLTALTDVLGGTSVTLATLKGFKFQLVSTTDDPVNGTAAASITIGNSGTNDHPLDMTAGTMTKILNNGEASGWATNAAAGRTVDATHKVIKILNNDAGLAAKVRYTIWG